ncbi:MAG: PQQ-binding-like beta-propeller repeat protein [Thermoproteota archaeon]
MEKITINKVATIALVTILTITAFMVIVPAGAQENIEIPSFLLLSVAPNPVGQGQQITVNAFMSKPAPELYEGITVEMKRPDGTKDEFGPYETDQTGGLWFTHTVEQVGEYTFQAEFPGQTMSGTYLKPTVSNEVTLTVQEEPVTMKYDSPPLPDDYWTRPIYATNWEWAEIGGNWLSLGSAVFASAGDYDATGNFQPYSEAPDTPHIMWTKPTHFGGQPGKPIPGDQMSQYMSTTIATNYFEPVIMNGILYYSQRAGPTAEQANWKAVDLRTGETIWTKEAGMTGGEVVRMGQIIRYHSKQEFGSWAFLYGMETGSFFQRPDFINAYDPMTGEFLFNITNVPGNQQFVMDLETTHPGTLLTHYTDGGNLTLWNSTKMIQPTMTGFDITYRPRGTYNWSDGIVWSVPTSFTIDGVSTGNLGIAAETKEVILLRRTPDLLPRWSEGATSAGYEIVAGIDAKTGETLWGPLNRTIPYGQEVTVVGAGDGVYVLHNKDTNEAYGYSLEDGDKMWGPVQLEGNAWSAIQRAAEVAYGKIYIFDFGGYVNAIDLETGNIEWTFHRGSSGYDAPYGVYALWYNGAVADGKLFLSEGSMYNPPVHPARSLAINTTTGELVWSILSYTGRMPSAIADGYVVQWNSMDNQIYTYGKGPSKTTVTTPDMGVSLGSSVTISGTVMDISPGAEQHGVAERFPNGLPAVADEDMRDWMEHVYMQQNCPEDLDGVQVKLTAVDPNGNTVDIGTTTSDGFGFYSYQWTPEMEGKYTITATFEGSKSYYMSYDETAVSVDPAPAETVSPTEQPAWYEEPVTPADQPQWYEAPPETVSPTEKPEWYQEPEEPPAYTTIDLALMAAVIVAIVIGIVNLMMLQKRRT